MLVTIWSHFQTSKKLSSSLKIKIRSSCFIIVFLFGTICIYLCQNFPSIYIEFQVSYIYILSKKKVSYIYIQNSLSFNQKKFHNLISLSYFIDDTLFINVVSTIIHKLYIIHNFDTLLFFLFLHYEVFFLTKMF